MGRYRGVASGAAALLALLALLSAAPRPAVTAAAGKGDELERHNVLEFFPTAALRSSSASRRERGIQLTYNVTELGACGDWVEVRFWGVPGPRPDDLLAVYAPPDAFASGAAPIKFANASDAKGYLANGGGALALRLLNVRTDMRVVFVRGGDAQPTVVAVGPIIRNSQPNQPTGVHLMRTRSPTEVLVQFTTRDAARPLARFGRAPDALDFSAPATTATYAASDMCGEPATGLGFLPPGLLHTAALSGLEPGERYWYQVGDAGLGVWSAVFSFLAPPPPGTGQSVHLLALADQGVGEPDGSFAAMEFQPALDVARLAEADGLAGPPGGGHYSLVLHAGDISYARGYSALWDAWLYQQQGLAARVPYMTCPGNHERDWLEGDIPYHTIDSGGECGVPYAARFPMPTSGQREQPWYSFDHGPIHLTVISTEHHFTAGSAQHAWLAADLAGVDRARTPWLVLVGHRPIYIDALDFGEQGKATTATQLQAALEYLLDEHGVDLAIAGHHHSYQRTCSVFRGECHGGRARGTVHLTVGHAGAAWYDNGADPPPAWIEREEQLAHGYARLHVNATHLHIEAIDSATGGVMDEVVLEPRVRGAPSAGAGLQDLRPLAAVAAQA